MGPDLVAASSEMCGNLYWTTWWIPHATLWLHKTRSRYAWSNVARGLLVQFLVHEFKYFIHDHVLAVRGLNLKWFLNSYQLDLTPPSELHGIFWPQSPEAKPRLWHCVVAPVLKVLTSHSWLTPRVKSTCWGNGWISYERRCQRPREPPSKNIPERWWNTMWVPMASYVCTDLSFHILEFDFSFDFY